MILREVEWPPDQHISDMPNKETAVPLQRESGRPDHSFKTFVLGSDRAGELGRLTSHYNVMPPNNSKVGL